MNKDQRAAFDEPCDYADTRRAITRASAEVGKKEVIV